MINSVLFGSLVLTLLSAQGPDPDPDPGPAAMTPEKMLATLNEIGVEVQVEGPVLRFMYEEVPLALVYDEQADRMRVVSGIMRVDDLQEGMLTKAMQANFHSVLDVRYAISDGVVWSAFIHPLSDLSDDLLRSAVHQVAVARVTFGTQYTSGAMVFGEPGEEPNAPGDGDEAGPWGPGGEFDQPI